MSFSGFLSIILHPIFIPLLCLYSSVRFYPQIFFQINNNLYYIYSVVIIFTIILPLFSTFLLIKNNRLKSIKMEDYKERPPALFRTAMWMSLGLYLLQNVLIYTPLLKAELFGVIIIVLFAAIISRFWKISLHLLAVGGGTGVFIALEIIVGGALVLISFFVLISGLLGYARIKENAHTQAQIYTGFFLGLIIELFAVLIY